MINLRFLLPSALGISLFAATVSSVSFVSSSSVSGENSKKNILLQASQELHEIAKRTTPAVVSITSIKSQDFQSKIHYSPSEDPDDADQATLGLGSGVVVRSDGLILTNHHVVQNAEQVTVAFDEKHKSTAHIIGGDPKTDLAVIQLDTLPSKKLSTLQFGDSDQLQVGDWTVAVGSPYGLSQSVTAGIVSAMGRGRLGMLDIEDFIQTDAAINPGNSGGPLLNSNGEMVGVNTAIFSQNGGFNGIGFAIPSKIAKKVFNEIIDHGYVIRGWIGMIAQDLDQDLAKYFKVSPDQGALVSEIEANGPADHASIKIGDIIISYGDKKVGSAGHLKALVAETKSSSQIPVQISRNGKIKTIKVTIREQPRSPEFHSSQLAGQAARRKKHPSPQNFGIAVQDIPPEISRLLNINPPAGVLITNIKAGSPAFNAGLIPGDVILAANQENIEGSKDFIEFIKKSKKSEITVLYVQRGPEEKVFVPLKSSIS